MIVAMAEITASELAGQTLIINATISRMGFDGETSTYSPSSTIPTLSILDIRRTLFVRSPWNHQCKMPNAISLEVVQGLTVC